MFDPQSLDLSGRQEAVLGVRLVQHRLHCLSLGTVQVEISSFLGQINSLKQIKIRELLENWQFSSKRNSYGFANINELQLEEINWLVDHLMGTTLPWRFVGVSQCYY